MVYTNCTKFQKIVELFFSKESLWWTWAIIFGAGTFSWRAKRCFCECWLCWADGGAFQVQQTAPPEVLYSLGQWPWRRHWREAFAGYWPTYWCSAIGPSKDSCHWKLGHGPRTCSTWPNRQRSPCPPSSGRQIGQIQRPTTITISLICISTDSSMICLPETWRTWVQQWPPPAYCRWPPTTASRPAAPTSCSVAPVWTRIPIRSPRTWFRRP